jgi:hypothetical protein
MIIYLIQVVYTFMVYAYWKITGKKEKYAKEKLDQLLSDILSIAIECYMEFLVGGYLQVNNLLNTNPVEKISTAIGYIILVVALILLPLASMKVMAQKTETLEEERFERSWGSLYEYIKIESRWTLLYPTVYMLKRQVLILTVFYVKT